MYCSNCGAENQEGAKFCSKCGAELNGVSNVPAQNYNEDKIDQNDINKIGQLAVELQQLDNIEKALAKKQQELAYVNESIESNNRNISNNRNLFLAMGGISLGIVFGILFIKLVFDVLLFTYTASRGTPYIPFFEHIGIFLLLGIIVAVVVGKKIYPTIKSSVEKNLTAQGKRLGERQIKTKTECEQIENDKQQLIKAISEKIGIIPPSYRYHMAVQFIYESLSNIRARNMTDAVNLYEEQLHRWKIEAAQQQMVDLARQQTTAAQINMAANVVSAGANIANAAHTKDIATNTINIANRIRGGY